MSSKFYVGVTDSRWFQYLAARAPDEVNFWIPSPKVGFRALPEGGLFLFKLHYPQNFVVGGGFFVRYTRLPLMLAWNAFGAKNGVDSLPDFLTALRRFRRDAHPSQDVGCVILAAPFFFPREQWIPAPESWSKNIVRGKGYGTDSDDRRELLAAVRQRLHAVGETDDLLDTETEPDRPLRLIRARLGQGAFRALVTDAYTRRCAISGERTLPALEAAHIKPYAESGPNRTENGLLRSAARLLHNPTVARRFKVLPPGRFATERTGGVLACTLRMGDRAKRRGGGAGDRRSRLGHEESGLNLHRLFDAGYVTVTPERRIEVSRRIKEEFENGRDYYRFHGNRLIVEPDNPAEKPELGYLEWHNQHLYRG